MREGSRLVGAARYSDFLLAVDALHREVCGLLQSDGSSILCSHSMLGSVCYNHLRGLTFIVGLDGSKALWLERLAEL